MTQSPYTAEQMRDHAAAFRRTATNEMLRQGADAMEECAKLQERVRVLSKLIYSYNNGLCVFVPGQTREETERKNYRKLLEALRYCDPPTPLMALAQEKNK